MTNNTYRNLLQFGIDQIKHPVVANPNAEAVTIF